MHPHMGFDCAVCDQQVPDRIPQFRVIPDLTGHVFEFILEELQIRRNDALIPLLLIFYGGIRVAGEFCECLIGFLEGCGIIDLILDRRDLRNIAGIKLVGFRIINVEIIGAFIYLTGIPAAVILLSEIPLIISNHAGLEAKFLSLIFAQTVINAFDQCLVLSDAGPGLEKADGFVDQFYEDIP